MNQDNEQLNSVVTNEREVKRKRVKFWDILLWVIIVVLLVAVFIRVFVVSRVEVSGVSMTAEYYNLESSPHYNPTLTYHNEDIVTVNKLKKPSRGDVVVFYKNAVSSKFLGNFARGDSIEQGGEYYKIIKRVVALGGDKLWIEQVGEDTFRLVVQPYGKSADELLHEDYYVKNNQVLDADCFVMPSNCLGRLADYTQDNPLTIDEGYFFAIGDNRVNSADSRGELGQVPLNQIFGVVVKES